METWSLAKPLLIMVLLPLLVGGAIRVFAPNAAESSFPVKKIGGLFLVLVLIFTLVITGATCWVPWAASPLELKSCS